MTAAIPISPRLIFLSAYTEDARTSNVSTRSNFLFGCPALPTSPLEDCAAAFANIVSGALGEVITATWTLSGRPTVAAVRLNATNTSQFFSALPLLHSFEFETSTLSAAVPPYTLYPAYYYTVTVRIAMRIAWAWDTSAFATRVFSAAVPPPVGSTLRSLGFSADSAIMIQTAIFGGPVPFPGYYAGLALVSAPPILRSVAVSPSTGVALFDTFNLSVAGALDAPSTVALDEPPAALTAAYISAVLSAAPLPPGLQRALAYSSTAAATEASFGAATVFCSRLLLLKSTFNATIAGALEAWELDLTLSSFALAVSSAVEAAYPHASSNSDSVLQAGEAVATAALGGSFSRTPFAAVLNSAMSPADLCLLVISQTTAALATAPFNASSFAPRQSITDDFANLSYSYRVGTQLLASSAAEGVRLSAALAASVPVVTAAGGDSFVAATSVNVTLPMLAFPSNTPTLVTVLARSNAKVFAAATAVISLSPPCGGGDPVSISDGVSTLASALLVSNTTSTSVAAILAAATLGTILSSYSSVRALENVTLLGGNVSALGTYNVASAIVAVNSATRSQLISVTVAALEELLARGSHSSSGGWENEVAWAIYLTTPAFKWWVGEWGGMGELLDDYGIHLLLCMVQALLMTRHPSPRHLLFAALRWTPSN